LGLTRMGSEPFVWRARQLQRKITTEVY
jgi:hypothetical protein